MPRSMRRASENVTSCPASARTSACRQVPARLARRPRARATGPASSESRSARARNGAMSSSTASRKRRRSSAQGASGASRAMLQRAVAALGDARMGRPRRRREHELGAVVVQAQRAVAHGADRHAQVVRPARAQLDRRRHGSSSAGSGGASAKPGAISSSVTTRSRRSRSRSSWSRGSPSQAATSSRGGATYAAACSSAAPPRRRWASPSSLRPSLRHELVRARAGEAGEPGRGAFGDGQRGGLTRRHGAQLRRRAPRAPPAAPARASGRTARRRRSRGGGRAAARRRA